MVGPKIRPIPVIPKTNPNNLLRLRFSPVIKKCARINVINGMIAISKPAMPEVTKSWPLAINQNGNTLPNKPMIIKCNHATGFNGKRLPLASINASSTAAPIDRRNTTTWSGVKARKLTLIAIKEVPHSATKPNSSSQLIRCSNCIDCTPCD